MEKGHFGQYTGNARHSRKEEMIHDRELIYDAKKQLHKADQDYKHDSPAKMYKDSPVNGNAFTKAMADSGGDYAQAKEALDSPLGAEGGINAGNANSNSTSVATLGTGMTFEKFAEGQAKKQKPYGIFSIGDKPASLKGSYGASEASTGGLGLTGGSGRSNPMTSARTTSASTESNSTESNSTSSYTTSGQGRRERRLGKAERKADLKKSQDKVVASRRLDKKASRIKNRAYVKGDRGATNQYKTTD